MKTQLIAGASALIFISLLIVLMMVSEPGGRHGPPPGYGPKLLQFDTDGDGRIAREEWMGGAVSLFGAMDGDRNGLLDLREFRDRFGEDGMPGPPAEMLFERIDTSGDRRISKAEWTDHHASEFTARDRDGDGVCSDDELHGPPWGQGGPPPKGMPDMPPHEGRRSPF
ncbi:MAG: hypothetical protein JXA20_10730 [Spirochaetes bacterium]|nr:hypothetical protein [Spirochaetota bacterium]